MRPLQRPQDHRHVVKLVMLALERQLVAGKALQAELEGLVVNLPGLREVEAVSACLERRDTAPDPEFEAPAAHLVEHADFLDQAQRMIERQEIDEGGRSATSWCAASWPRGAARAKRRSRAASNDA